MCGIVGYVGDKNCLPTLIDGLRRLEYRGYDSAGVALGVGEKLQLVKAKGKLSNLESELSSTNLSANIGIGHTRWATHGVPSKENAHPHTCCASNIAVVHNGILENYLELKMELEEAGHRFESETDTEVLAHLIEQNNNNGSDFVEAVEKSLGRIKGSYAIGVINMNDPDMIVAAKKDSPLVIGYGEGENYLASDIPAILDKTRQIQILEDDEMAILKTGSVRVVKGGKKVNKKIVDITWDLEAAEKGGFEDFMLKEMFEQPKAIKETLRAYIKDDDVDISSMGLSDKKLASFERIFITACGSSFHAAWVGKLAIEEWAKIPVEIEISSEFRYRFPVIEPNTLLLAITQSGETADTLAAIREAKKRGHKVVSITNVLGSTITRETNGSLVTQAGPEIGVAATKTFVAQLVALYLIALKLARVKGSLEQSDYELILGELKQLPEYVEKSLQKKDEIKKMAETYHKKPDFLFLGRGFGLPIALEGALKLKEISYIHAEGCAAGEIKHGPIALIDEDCPVVAIANKSATYAKVRSNIEEVKARGADVIAVISEGDDSLRSQLDHCIEVPAVIEAISPVTTIVGLQLFSYYIAKAKGLNVDQPRNLAKSVTVE